MRGSRMLKQSEGLQTLVVGASQPKHYRFSNRGPGKVKVSWGSQPGQQVTLDVGDSVDVFNSISIQAAHADPPDGVDHKLIEWEALSS